MDVEVVDDFQFLACATVPQIHRYLRPCVLDIASKCKYVHQSLCNGALLCAYSSVFCSFYD